MRVVEGRGREKVGEMKKNDVGNKMTWMRGDDGCEAEKNEG